MSTIFHALALSASILLVGGTAGAQAPAAIPGPEKTITNDSAKHHDRRRGHRGYRERHRASRYDHNRLRRAQYRDRHRSVSRRHYTAPCWRENRYGQFRRAPALISVRVCADRRGRTVVQRGSVRLVHYLRPNPRRRYY